MSITTGTSSKISIGNFEIWVLNKSLYVSDIKINIQSSSNSPDENTKESDVKQEVYEKVKSIFKENKVEEYYIELN